MTPPETRKAPALSPNSHLRTPNPDLLRPLHPPNRHPERRPLHRASGLAHLTRNSHRVARRHRPLRCLQPEQLPERRRIPAQKHAIMLVHDAAEISEHRHPARLAILATTGALLRYMRRRRWI